MSDFFSFVGDGYGNFLYSDWNKRKSNLNEKWDSHAKILTDHKIPPAMQDRWSKYEYNPITKAFNIDGPVDGHDHQAAENWVNHLDFKQIVEPLIIKKIKNPLIGKPKKVTEEEICLLKNWASVWASVKASVWDSVWDSIWAFARASVKGSVWASVWVSVWSSVWTSVWYSVWGSIWASIRRSVGASVRASVWGSVWDSVWASVRVYHLSFFKIEYVYDFSSCIKLWESGFVPSFDGKTWRLHSGKNAKIVYEEVIK